MGSKLYNIKKTQDQKYKIKVPGSLMLFGEHAVLHGSLAIVYAVKRYITVTLTPRLDEFINIKSNLLGNFRLKITNFKIQAPWELVLTAIASQLKKLPNGFNLIIESDFSAQIGLGSSAAVVVAIIKVLKQWLEGHDKNAIAVVKAARKVIRAVQGVGSGADVAASVFGGVISYQMQPLAINRLLSELPLVAVYSGNKVPTKKVIQKVNLIQAQHTKIFKSIFAAIDNCTRSALIAIHNKDWQKLGQLMNIHQGLQDAIGVNNSILSELIFSLRQNPNIYGAKISGSGLGDCVIGLGTLPTNYFPQNTRQKRLGVKQL